jgi:adenylate cyclase
MLSTCYMAVGDQAKLRSAAEMMVSKSQLAVKEDPSNGAALGILAGGYALLGEEEKTREWIDRALLVDPDNLNMRYNFACILAANLGDKEGALKMLESTIPQAAALQVRIADTDTDLDCLRDDPRFQKMMEQAKKRVGIDRPKTVTSAAQP